jgi:hypothetical protein
MYFQVDHRGRASLWVATSTSTLPTMHVSCGCSLARHHLIRCGSAACSSALTRHHIVTTVTISMCLQSLLCHATTVTLLAPMFEVIRLPATPRHELLLRPTGISRPTWRDLKALGVAASCDNSKTTSTSHTSSQGLGCNIVVGQQLAKGALHG